MLYVHPALVVNPSLFPSLWLKISRWLMGSVAVLQKGRSNQGDKQTLAERGLTSMYR